MKRIIILELCFLFLATTFQSDRMTGWVQQTIPRSDLAVKDLQFVDTLTGFMVQSRNSPDTSFISMTTDGGNNWTVTQLAKTYLTSMQFINKTTGFCVGRDSIPIDALIMKTTNGGETWNKHSKIGGRGRLIDVVFVNNDTGWVCGDELLFGGVFRTTNGGISWQMQMDYTSGPSKVFFVNSNTGWVIGSSDYKLYKTTNCGVNWFAQAAFTTIIKDVYFITQSLGWISSYVSTGQNGLMKSTDGGNNWFGVNNPYPTGDANLFFLDSLYGWAGSGSSKIVLTKDGLNWGYQIVPGYSHYVVKFLDTLHGWAGGGGFDLIHTTDGGGTIVSAKEAKTEIPKEFSLEQNYPNPFNQSSIIQFKVQSSKFIKLVVYDLSGREVKTLVNEYKQAGTYQERFDAKDLPSGIYFYRLTSGDFSETKKMILTK